MISPAVESATPERYNKMAMRVSTTMALMRYECVVVVGAGGFKANGLKVCVGAIGGGVKVI